MKLEGSLDAFSLPDIFQLLTFTRKSGGLHLHSGTRDGVVWFAGGEVTGASADASRQTLARRVVATGVVREETLRAAVERATTTEGLGVVRALVESGDVDGEAVRAVAREQTVDAVYDVLRWTEADFTFAVGETDPDDVGITLPVEQITEQTGHRDEQWQRLRAVVPSPAVVLRMPVTAPESTGIDVREWELLALVDGRRSVADLLELSGRGQFAALALLAALVERGLLVAADGSDPVTELLRRQALLAPLERFEPVAAPPVPASREPGPDDDGPRGGGAPAPVHAAPPADLPVEHVAVEPVPHEHVPGLEPIHASAGPVPVAAHEPFDVVPSRPEPFLPRRRAEFAEERTEELMRGRTPEHQSAGSVAFALDPEHRALIERDPTINRTLMLRLIAGVRGL